MAPAEAPPAASSSSRAVRFARVPRTPTRVDASLDSLPVVVGVRRALADAASPEDGVRGVLNVVGDSLGWLVGSFWAPSPGEPDVLRARSTWRARVHARTGFEAATRSRAFAPGQGFPGKVWEAGAPVWTGDMLSDGRFLRHGAAAAEGLRGAVAFPVVGTDGGVLGVLEFFTDELRVRVEMLLPVFGLIGREVGAYLERRPLRDPQEGG